MKILAFDVSMDNLDIFDGQQALKVRNQATDIQSLLKQHKAAAVVCEPTGRYHLLLVETAIRLGHTVYIVNPREAKNYKESLCFRAKTDKLDAQYLYEYVKRNQDLLRPHKQIDEKLRQIRELLGRRQAFVDAKTAITQSLGKKLSQAETEAIQALQVAIKDLEASLEVIARSYESYARLRTLPGVGPISAYALLYVLESHEFQSSDALVAFLGLDVRVRQSGKYRGIHKLSKRGDPLLRHMACMAGRALYISKFGKAKKAELEAKGRKYAERMVIGARKLLRVAYAIFYQKTSFDPQKWKWA